MKQLLLLIAFASTGAGLGATPVDLTPAATAWSEAARVEARLRISGRVTPESESQPRPISLDIDLAYHQEGLKPEGTQTRRVMRQIDRLATSPPGAPTLRDDRRSLVVRTTPSGSVVAALGGPLTRGEIDLTELPADPLDIHQLLPTGPVRDGGTWKLDATAVGRLLRIEADTLCEATAVVTDITPRHVKLRFAGPVHGHNDGAEVEIDLRGVALFDRQSQRLTRINLGWRETRRIGPATPALEATAKLNVTIEPAADGDRIPVTDLLLAETTRPDERLQIETADRAWALLGDRDWFVVAGDKRATTLRRVEAGRVVAVTTLTPASQQGITPGQLEREVRYSLGKQLHQVTGTEQAVSSSGLAVDAIASVGMVEGQPVEWRHHLVSAQASKLTVTTTLAATEGPADDDALRRLIDSISTKASKTAAAEATAVRR